MVVRSAIDLNVVSRDGYSMVLLPVLACGLTQR